MDSFKRRTARNQRNQLIKGLICLVFAVFFTVSARAQFTAPAVVVQPTVLNVGGIVPKGGIAIMQATLSSLSTVTLAWYNKDGELISPKKITTVNVANVGIVTTLNLTNCSNSDAGKYYLRATNSFGYVTSSNVNLVIANVVTTVVSNTASFVSSATGITTSGFQIGLTGPTGSNVIIQASSDMIHWTPISTNTFVSGSVNFTDAAAKTNRFRYYRTYSP
jgi:hypothetical protein